MGRLNAAELDGVTIDAYGTLVTLVDPVPALTSGLAAHGVDRDPDAVAHAFAVEVAHYSAHSAQGHDEAGLAQLQRDCTQVFLKAAEAPLDAEAFTPVFAAAMHFEVLPGVVSALERLRALGVELAVVANWDLTLRRLLEETGLARHFGAIVHASGKPVPDGLLRALAQLKVEPARALHIGDGEVDELAASAAGMRFLPAPLPGAVAELA
ncbi:MAG: HAD family hydrolase [Gaiellaceae bacterium]|jgi:HAD superfamily hydrolase (TIGR01509 family)